MTGPIIDVRNLSKHFSVRQGLLKQLFQRRSDQRVVRAVDSVSFCADEGEILGLVGESGSGKSTTGFTALKLLEPTSGSIVFRGDDIASYKGRALLNFRRQAQIIFQDPYQSLNPRFTIADSVTEPLTIHGLARGQPARTAVREVLDNVGLRPPSAFVDRFPHELSGGQRQRVAIARAMVLQPKLLVADEPVSMLDVSVRAGILKLLRKFSEERGLTILYISHDMSTVRYLCDRTMVLYMGRVVETGPTATVLSDPKHPYTRTLLAAVPRIQAGRQRDRVELPGDISNLSAVPSGCAFHPRCASSFYPCPSIEPQGLRLEGDDRTVACHLFDGSLARKGMENSR